MSSLILGILDFAYSAPFPEQRKTGGPDPKEGQEDLGLGERVVVGLETRYPLMWKTSGRLLQGEVRRAV
jgi:hypothetical protein